MKSKKRKYKKQIRKQKKEIEHLKRSIEDLNQQLTYSEDLLVSVLAIKECE